MVLECTSRLVSLDEGGALLEWKHHAHVHAVVVGPFMGRERLINFSNCLVPMGLGRINYQAIAWSHDKSGSLVRNAVSDYISKYLVKQETSSRTWGVMRNAS